MMHVVLCDLNTLLKRNYLMLYYVVKKYKVYVLNLLHDRTISYMIAMLLVYFAGLFFIKCYLDHIFHTLEESHGFRLHYSLMQDIVLQKTVFITSLIYREIQQYHIKQSEPKPAVLHIHKAHWHRVINHFLICCKMLIRSCIHEIIYCILLQLFSMLCHLTVNIHYVIEL